MPGVITHRPCFNATQYNAVTASASITPDEHGSRTATLTSTHDFISQYGRDRMPSDLPGNHSEEPTGTSETVIPDSASQQTSNNKPNALNEHAHRPRSSTASVPRRLQRRNLTSPLHDPTLTRQARQYPLPRRSHLGGGRLWPPNLAGEIMSPPRHNKHFNGLVSCGGDDTSTYCLSH